MRSSGFGALVIERLSLAAPRVPAGRPALKLAHLSDLHLRELGPEHEQVIAALQAERPDFVLLTGDLISSDRRTWASLEAFAGRLPSAYGAFACRGNWEVKAGPRPSVLRNMLSDWGVTLLVNESRTLRTPFGVVRLAGLDDLAKGWPDIRAALAPAPDAHYTVLLAHAPLAADLLEETPGVDLLLAGHTHGGQVRLPLVWRALVPGYRGRYLAGLYRTPWGHLYVSRGLGGVGVVPLRLRCPSEMAVFHVSPRDHSA